MIEEDMAMLRLIQLKVAKEIVNIDQQWLIENLEGYQ